VAEQGYDIQHIILEVKALQYILGAETKTEAPHLREKARMLCPEDRGPMAIRA
jgi:hypothetical protein